jgi:hypothetical protein
MVLKINDNGIDRDMTPDEEAAYLAWQKIAQAEAVAQAEAQAAKDAKKIAVLNKLGLTQDELAALFS